MYPSDRNGVRIFVPSHRPPGPTVANYPLVTYVNDGIASAMAQAKAAAGDRYVLVHGNGERHAGAGDDMSCKHREADGSKRVHGSDDVHDADGNG